MTDFFAKLGWFALAVIAGGLAVLAWTHGVGGAPAAIQARIREREAAERLAEAESADAVLRAKIATSIEASRNHHLEAEIAFQKANAARDAVAVLKKKLATMTDTALAADVNRRYPSRA